MAAREKLFQRIYGAKMEMPSTVEKIDFYMKVFKILKPDRMLVETQQMQNGPFITNRPAILKGEIMDDDVMLAMFKV